MGNRSGLELRNDATVFFPMYSFSYGLSYRIFSSKSGGFTIDDCRVEGRDAAFADGAYMFFGP